MTAAVKPGANAVDVRVVNVWHNRLVGQQREPAAMASPAAWASTTPRYGKDEPLLPAGLLGPVTVRGAEVTAR